MQKSENEKSESYCYAQQSANIHSEEEFNEAFVFLYLWKKFTERQFEFKGIKIENEEFFFQPEFIPGSIGRFGIILRVSTDD